MVKIVVPELGEGIVSARIVHWNFQEGARVTPDDDVVELVTDKAVFNVPAPASGRISKVLCREGEEVPIGAVLAELE
jgi:pyruvate dehydrogenase E2 component (dihydrolipoamide acetyltransferase)